MPHSRRRRTIDTILLAARYEFADKGYQGASYGLIAARAGIDKGVVSHHFGRKQELAIAVVDSAATSGVMTSPEVDGGQVSGVEAVLTYIADMAAALAGSTLARAATRLLKERRDIPADLPNLYRHMVATVAVLLDDAAGSSNRAHVDIHAKIVVSLFSGMRDIAILEGWLDELMEEVTCLTALQLSQMGYNGAEEAAQRVLERRR